MRRRNFMAVHDIPRDTTRDALVAALTRVTEQTHRLGIVVDESFFSIERGSAFHYVSAGTEEQVRSAFTDSGLPAPDVFPAEHIYTDLLLEDRQTKS